MRNFTFMRFLFLLLVLLPGLASARVSKCRRFVGSRYVRFTVHTNENFGRPTEPGLYAVKQWQSSLPEPERASASFSEYLAENGIHDPSLAKPEVLRELWIKFGLVQWSKWQSLNDTQREALLRLELLKLSPPANEAGAEVQLMARQEFVRISAANRKRLIERLRQLKPIDHLVSEADSNSARQLAEGMKFHYFRPRDPQGRAGPEAPVPSPRDLARLGEFELASYYPGLVEDSSTVGFEAYVTRSDQGAETLLPRFRSPTIRLEDEFAGRFGFMLPRFDDARDLMRVLSIWHPTAMTDLLRYLHSRHSLPRDVATAADLRIYLSTDQILETFAPPSAYRQLAPLRWALVDFVMTEADGTAFLREAFEHYLHLMSANPDSFKKLISRWRTANGAIDVFRSTTESSFLKFIGWSGISLRVPGAVPPSHFTILNGVNSDDPTAASSRPPTVTGRRGLGSQPTGLDHGHMQ